MKISKRFDGVFLSAAFAFFAFSTVARMLAATDPAATWSEAQRMVVIYRFDALMFGMFAAWLSVRFPEALAQTAIARRPRRRRVLLLAMYATLWKIENHQLAFGDDSYFARTFRFTLRLARLRPAPALGFGLEADQGKLLQHRGPAHRALVLRTLSRPSAGFPDRDRNASFRDSTSRCLKALSSFALQIGGAIVLSALLYRFFESRCTRLREKAAPAVARIFPRA